MTGDIEVVRHPRARRAKLSVDPTSGAIRLTLPPRASERRALEWAKSQRDWIARQRATLPTARPFVPGASIPFGDAVLTLEWMASAPRAGRIANETLTFGGPRDGFERRVERWLRAQALSVLTGETTRIAERAGVSVARVSIGDPHGRWGSCSSSGTIRYSWRLILAPHSVLQATVAHEVAHRVHMHHGPDFHALVGQISDSDPKIARAWLRRNGAALHWFGRSN